MFQLPHPDGPESKVDGPARAVPAEPPPYVQMLRMMMGYWVAQTAAAIARLDIAEHLAAGPRSAAELARLAGADLDALHRLLRAAASVGILRETGRGSYANTPVGETLRKDVPGSLHDLVIAELAQGHWLPWGRLFDAVKAGKSQAQASLGCSAWEYYQKTPEEGACFARGMSNLSAIVAAEVLPAYDFSGFGHIVDVGGSEGVMLAGALRAATLAKGVLFDLPEVIERGRGAVSSHGLGSRIEQMSGDFLKEVPAGGDLYILKSILHDWDDQRSITILQNVRRAARPQAKVLVIEMVLPEGVSPSPVHLMDLNMLVMLDGRERTEKEFAELLSRAELRFDRVIPSHGLFSLIEATRV